MTNEDRLIAAARDAMSRATLAEGSVIVGTTPVEDGSFVVEINHPAADQDKRERFRVKIIRAR